MKRIETTTSARVILSLVALLVATPASALTMVSYDGSGSPTGDGFIITGNAGIFTLDSDDGTAGSAPGFLYQSISPGSPDGHWDHLSPANDDLNDTEGWFVETRFNVLADQRATDDGFGIANELRSSGGLYWTRMSTDGIKIGFTTLDVAYPGPGPFHTLRYECSAGCGTPEIFLDGVSQGTVAYTGGPNADRTFEFGDLSVSGAGEVVWDYVVINQEIAAIPEPSSLAMLTLGLAALGLRRKRVK